MNVRDKSFEQTNLKSVPGKAEAVLAMAHEPLVFKQSDPLTMGIELELQIVNTRDYDLTRGSTDLLEALKGKSYPGEIKPEITESMIELSTDVQTRADMALKELETLRDLLVRTADKLNLALCGGGTHPFQKWHERRIYDTPRYHHVSGLYGYLAKQFTVFGQHVHIGCPSGDDALYLTHSLARFIPHFIALSAASPFYQGADTAFDSSRLNVVTAFPLSGYAPYLTTWDAFNAYFAKMRRLGIVESMKDFYWDIRPKPEYGTIEIRVCDTPLTVARAAQLAAYAQTLCRWLLRVRPPLPGPDVYLTYSYNRFQACRFGLAGHMIDAIDQRHRVIRDDILITLGRLQEDALALGSEDLLAELLGAVATRTNDARWLRDTHSTCGSLPCTVRKQSDRWRE